MQIWLDQVRDEPFNWDETLNVSPEALAHLRSGPPRRLRLLRGGDGRPALGGARRTEEPARRREPVGPEPLFLQSTDRSKRPDHAEPQATPLQSPPRQAALSRCARAARHLRLPQLRRGEAPAPRLRPLRHLPRPAGDRRQRGLKEVYGTGQIEAAEGSFPACRSR